MYKVGTRVIDRWGNPGIINIVYFSWEDLKKKSDFITLDPDDESNLMDDVEKLINGDPKDLWLELQEKPFTEEQLLEPWYSVLCDTGGSISSCHSELTLENKETNLEEFFETGKYTRLINPSVLFKNIEEFKVFLEIDPNRENLESTLRICEQEELYEYCELVKQKLNDPNIRFS